MFDDNQRWSEHHPDQTGFGSSQQAQNPTLQRLSQDTSRKRQSLTQDDLNMQFVSQIHLNAGGEQDNTRQMCSSPLKRNRSSRILQPTSTPVRGLENAYAATQSSNSQTQTPPPSSTGRNYRKVSTQNRLSMGSTAALAPPYAAETPVRSTAEQQGNFLESPVQLQQAFGGDMFSDPMSAPAIPSQRFYWDASPTLGQPQMQTRLASSHMQQNHSSQMMSTPQQGMFSPPPMFLFGTETAPLDSRVQSPTVPSSDQLVYSDTSYPYSDIQETPTSAPAMHRSVDPNMIFKFPVQHSPVAPTIDHRVTRQRPISGQFSENTRQKELESLRNPKTRAALSRTSSNRSVQTLASLKRNSLVGKATSNATSNPGTNLKPRPLSRVGSLFPETLSRRNSTTSLRRAASAASVTSSNATFRTRTVVSFKIDANGRARTETTEVSEPDLDSAASVSRSEEEDSEPGDFLDDSSDSDEELFASRRGSMAFSFQERPGSSHPTSDATLTDTTPNNKNSWLGSSAVGGFVITSSPPAVESPTRSGWDDGADAQEALKRMRMRRAERVA
jgi:hypothetical protein